ncbi:hypothetical protein Daesc_009533 [Daldinia eschscholtzii]|uniref:Uncharacterized protein n=1 Tax=Daldinia eschscholtzii TaxID=292717 RepID=A0AAX6MAF2_9PEZI
MQRSNSPQPPASWINYSGRPRGPYVPPMRQTGPYNPIPAMGHGSNFARMSSLEGLGQGNMPTASQSATKYCSAELAAEWLQHLESYTDTQRRIWAINRTTAQAFRPEEQDMFSTHYDQERPGTAHRETLSGGPFPGYFTGTNTGMAGAVSSPDRVSRLEYSVLEPNCPPNWATQHYRAGESTMLRTSERPTGHVSYGLQYPSGLAATPDMHGGFSQSDYLNQQWQQAEVYRPSLPLNYPTAIPDATPTLPPARVEPAGDEFILPSPNHSPTENVFAQATRAGSSTNSGSGTLYQELLTPTMSTVSSPSNIDTHASVSRVNVALEEVADQPDELNTGNGSPRTIVNDSVRLNDGDRAGPIPITISISIEFDDSVFDIQGYNITTRPRSRQVGEN